MKPLSLLTLLLVLAACDSAGNDPLSGRYVGTVSVQLLDSGRADAEHVLTVREGSTGALTGDMVITIDGQASTYTVTGARRGSTVDILLFGGEEDVRFQGYASADAYRVNLAARWSDRVDEYGLTLTSEDG